MYDMTKGSIGFQFDRPENPLDTAGLQEFFGWVGLAVSKRVMDTSGLRVVRNKYLTLTFHKSKENEVEYNLATECLTLRLAVQWWSSSLSFMGGVPPVPPEGRESWIYSRLDNEWHEDPSNVPVITEQLIKELFPDHMDKKYR